MAEPGRNQTRPLSVEPTRISAFKSAAMIADTNDHGIPSNKDQFMTAENNFISADEIQHLTKTIARHDDIAKRPLSGVINNSFKMKTVADDAEYYKSATTNPV